MVVGYVLLGGFGGAIAAALHLILGNGSFLGAVGMFYGTSTVTILALASRVAMCRFRREQRRYAMALAAPLPAFPLPRHQRGHLSAAQKRAI